MHGSIERLYIACSIDFALIVQFREPRPYPKWFFENIKCSQVALHVYVTVGSAGGESFRNLCHTYLHLYTRVYGQFSIETIHERRKRS